MWKRIGILGLAFGLAGAGTGAPERAADVRPLQPGSRAPDVALRTLEGARWTLGQVLGKKPAILVFYRGGW